MRKNLIVNYVLLVSMLSSAVMANDDFVVDPFLVKSINTHQMTILNHGLASLEDRLQLIESATESIDVEYFIYRIDKSAQILTQALVKKAQEGVKVRMLLDYFMVKKDLDAFYTHELREQGIEVKYFNTTSTLNLFSGQYRNHRKVLLIDGKVAITGGRNIGDEYFDMHSEYNFLDRDVRIEGEMVGAIKQTFDETFVAKKSEIVKRQRMPKRTDAKYRHGNSGSRHGQFRSDLRRWEKKVQKAKDFAFGKIDEGFYQLVREKGKEELGKEYTGTCNQLTYQSEYPSLGKKNRRNYRIIKHELFDRIEKAESSILIDSPYFIVNKELGSSLKTALDNNVEVTLLTNSLNSTDAVYVYAAFDTDITKWVNKGLHPYIYKGEKPASYDIIPSFIPSKEARYGVHAKSIIFDDKDLVIGTYNIDPRSANYNSEMIVICENSPEIALKVKENIQERMDLSIYLNSKQAVKDAEFYQTGFGKKLLYYFVKLPANWFDYLL